MEMKQYLSDTFKFNDKTNKKLLRKISLLPDQKESIRLFSHLINCQYKWLARIKHDANVVKMSWWEPVYKFDQLEEEWNKSLSPWLTYIDSKTDEELAKEITFIGQDGSQLGCNSSRHCFAIKLPFHSSPGANTNPHPPTRN